MKCPRDIETEADADDSSAEVAWQPPVALDNSGIRPIVTVVPAIEPPKRFPIGFTKVKYLAEDLSGNKVKCTFTVRVKGKYLSFPINLVKKKFDECLHRDTKEIVQLLSGLCTVSFTMLINRNVVLYSFSMAV